MGTGVIINPVTGIISGIAPDSIGTYVVAVTANEYRGGVLIRSTRKEIHIDVGNCQLTAASLKPNYSTCDGYAITFKNETATLPGTIYEWDFGNPASGVNNISFSPTPTHVFTDTGIYRIKLKAKGTAGCAGFRYSISIYLSRTFSLPLVIRFNVKIFSSQIFLNQILET
ncbi:MAG: PKD domain-containing protein [Chitinophagaceae bacterium]